MSDETSASCRNKDPIGDKPLLASYALFAICAAAVSIAMFFSPKIAKPLLPHLGWPIVGLSYLGSLMFVAATWLSPNDLPLAQWWTYLRGHFSIIIAYGIFTAAIGWLGNDFDNPYLAVSMWQPIWTVLTPAAWMLLFYYQIHRHPKNDNPQDNKRMNRSAQ